jgi:hypothetical protein
MLTMTSLVDRLLPEELWQRIRQLLPAKELGCGLDDFTGARVACSAGRALEHTTGE